MRRNTQDAKFSDPQLHDCLCGTDGYTLVERTDSDSHWGDGPNGNGRNLLGIMLMNIRDTKLRPPLMPQISAPAPAGALGRHLMTRMSAPAPIGTQAAEMQHVIRVIMGAVLGLLIAGWLFSSRA